MPASNEISIHELYDGQIIPFNKPPGWTSFDVVKKLRNCTRIKKIGHAGTLDPFATGLLLICFSRATKQVERLMQLDKEYVATLKLGVTTDTDDLTGQPIKTETEFNVSRTQLLEALAKFKGEIQQIPPMFSALKHNGKRLYKLAREGKLVERPPRTVQIHELDLQRFEKGIVQIRVVCSKGTYIRALARDIGDEVRCGAHVSELTRTRIGGYQLDSAWNLSEFEKQVKATRLINENPSLQRLS